MSSLEIPYINAISIFLLGCLFTMAAVTKIFDKPQFLQSLQEFGISKHKNLVYGVIVLIELSSGILFLINYTILQFQIVLLLLLIFFTAIQMYYLFQGKKPSCGCFGTSSSKEISWKTVLRNVFLIGLVILTAGEHANGEIVIERFFLGLVLAFTFQILLLLLQNHRNIKSKDRAMGLI